MKRLRITRSTSFGRFTAARRVAAAAVMLIAVGGVAVPAVSAKKKLLSGATTVALIRAGGETCGAGPTNPIPPATQSTATISATSSTVSATVNLVGAKPFTTYNVQLSTCKGAIIQKLGIGFVSTDASGNGSTAMPITATRGTSDGAILTALGSGQLLALETVVRFS